MIDILKNNETESDLCERAGVVGGLVVFWLTRGCKEVRIAKYLVAGHSRLENAESS